MINLGTYPEVAKFLDSVCGHVRAKKLHSDIKEELSVHLEQLVQDNLANGMPEQEAIEAAVSRMGDPRDIGRQLDHTHRPRTDWVMLALIALLSGAGLLAMYKLQSYGMRPAGHVDYFDRKMVHTGIGIIVMAVLWACDYQIIKKYSEYIFGFGILLLVWASSAGTIVNGQSAWYDIGPIGFYIPTIAIMLMIAGLAGIKPMREQEWRGAVLLVAYRGILPIFLFMQINVNTMAAVYWLIFISYLWMTKRYAWQAIAFAAGSALMVVYAVMDRGYLYPRVIGFLNWKDDPQGSGYLTARSQEAMQAAGLWGKGDLSSTLPLTHSEAFLPGFIYTFGWVAGAAVLLLILAFIGKTAAASAMIKDSYGKILFIGIGTLFVLQYFWAVAMTFGYAPYAGISLPLLSYGGTDQVFQFAALGLLLGIYRRRDMVPLTVQPVR